MFAVWLSVAFGIECVEPVPATALVEMLDTGEAAYLEFDDVGFRDAVNQVGGLLLPCMAERLEPEVVGRTHRMIALHLYELGQEESALSSMRAARLSDPEGELSTELVAADHPLRSAWEVVEADETRKVPEPRAGSISFDGVSGRARPRDRSTIAQLVDDAGMARTTVYLGPREPLPAYDAIPRRRNALLGCSGGALVTSGVLYGLTWGQRGSLFITAEDQSLTADPLDSQRASVNALSAVSTGLFGVAVGCGVGAAVVGPR